MGNYDEEVRAAIHEMYKKLSPEKKLWLMQHGGMAQDKWAVNARGEYIPYSRLPGETNDEAIQRGIEEEQVRKQQRK